jgi:hypothetical protein
MPLLVGPGSNSSDETHTSDVVPEAVGVGRRSAGNCYRLQFANLGNLNETDDPGEAMPRPGVLADEQGETPLKLETGADKKSEKSAQAIAPVTDEQAEFEQFKKWDDLRTHGAETPEYQEFLEWIKYQKFKAGQ